jgi:TRAP transporter TAXI family solute receptor
MRRAGVFLSGLALAALIACSPGPLGTASARGLLVISTGSPRGVYYAWAQSLSTQLQATNPGLTVLVEPSSGSVLNLQRLADHAADLALTTVDATEQRAPEPGPVSAADASDSAAGSLRALARVYDDYLHIIVRARSPVRTVADLAGRPVAVGVKGSGTVLIAHRILDAAELTVKERDIDVVAGTQALTSGSVDAVFWSGGIPTQAITDAAARTPLRLLPLGRLTAVLQAKYGTAYRPATIPPGRYGSTRPVATLASANLLVSRADADPAMVTAVLTTLFARRDEIAATVPAANGMDRRTAIWTGGLRLHPAAAAYYRRTKP